MYDPQSQPLQPPSSYQYQQPVPEQSQQSQQPSYQYRQSVPEQPPFQYQQQLYAQFAQQPPMQANVMGHPLDNQYRQWQVQAQFTKSYTTPAVITLVLYIFLWVPGLIANVIYLIEANKTKQITGTTPDGYGCLVALLCAVAAPGLLGGIIFMMILLGTAGMVLGH